jgi:hypothetical protein
MFLACTLSTSTTVIARLYPLNDGFSCSEDNGFHSYASSHRIHVWLSW